MRRVELVGWRRIPFGHMFRRVKIVFAIDLRTGSMANSEEGRFEVEDFERFRERVKEGIETGWDVGSLGGVMEGFWSGCADDY